MQPQVFLKYVKKNQAARSFVEFGYPHEKIVKHWNGKIVDYV
jgi:hypothetical protein